MDNESIGRGNAVIRICGDLDIAVPDRLQLMTTYVLREQEDWFEDEIKFLRRYLRTGMRALDVGANYGLYALSMARTVGASGRVVAVEPCSSTAALLRASIALNRIGNLELVQSALSNRSGTARLQLNANSELNALSAGGPATDSSEPVELKTLDALAQDYRLDHLDFLKMDAEGEEQRILEGGHAFLVEHSPLIMYEIKAGSTLNLDLIFDFSDLGYDSYRLLPGLAMLVPADVAAGIDAYQLNLFCCKKGRSEMLCREGILVTGAESSHGVLEADLGLERLAQQPFAAGYRDQWLSARPSSRAQFVECAAVLGRYAAAHETRLPPAARYAALRAAYRRMEALCEGTDNAYRLGTYARIAWEMGHRAQAVEALTRALDALNDGSTPEISAEPFLPASPHFDTMDPAGRGRHWLAAAILDQLLSLASFSSYFADLDKLKHYEFLRQTGFQRPEMERRRQLLRMRAGLQTAPAPSPLLAEFRADNLNPSYWGSR